MAAVEGLHHMMEEQTVADALAVGKNAVVVHHFLSTHHFSTVLQNGNPEFPVLTCDDIRTESPHSFPVRFPEHTTCRQHVLPSQQGDIKLRQIPFSVPQAEKTRPRLYDLHFGPHVKDSSRQRNEFRDNQVVGIKRHDVLTSRLADGMVTGTAYTGIFLMKHPHTAVLLSMPASYLEGVVGGTIIDDDDFERMIGAGRCRPEGFLKGGGSIVGGNDD